MAIARLILAVVLLGSPLGTAGGFEDSGGARTFELERDLRTLRGRVERAPRASSFDLQSLQRRLREQRTENPRDPSLQEIARELDHLRAKADRGARRSAPAVFLPSSLPLSTSAPIDNPRYLGGIPTPVTAPPARPYLGQRVVAMQRNATEIERRLDRGDTATAARLLQAVESDVATLRAVFSNVVAEDPNIIALESQIRALEHRLKAD